MGTQRIRSRGLRIAWIMLWVHSTELGLRHKDRDRISLGVIHPCDRDPFTILPIR